MAANSTTLPTARSFSTTTLFYASPAPTFPNKTRKPNAFYALSTTGFAPFSCTLTCLPHGGLKPSPLPPISSTIDLASLASLPHHTSFSLGRHLNFATYAYSGASVIPTCSPLLPTNSPHDRLPAFFCVIPMTARDIVATIPSLVA